MKTLHKTEIGQHHILADALLFASSAATAGSFPITIDFSTIKKP